MVYAFFDTYPTLLAAAAIAAEQVFSRSRLGWMRPLSLIVIVGGQLALLPVIVPVIPIEKLGAYLDSLPFEVPRSEVSHRNFALPQHYADQFGWRVLTALVADGWQRIPEPERSDCAIFGQNYGEAGAIDFFGPRYGLPPSISGHLTYYLWGPRTYTGNCMLVIADRKAEVVTGEVSLRQARQRSHIHHRGGRLRPDIRPQDAGHAGNVFQNHCARGVS